MKCKVAVLKPNSNRPFGIISRNVQIFKKKTFTNEEDFVKNFFFFPESLAYHIFQLQNKTII
jgi:hypothetical protein